MNPSDDRFNKPVDPQRASSGELPDRSSSKRLQCPACRARQALNKNCRRCHADLSLIVSAIRRIDFLQARLDQSKYEEVSRASSIRAELKLLIGTAQKMKQ